MNIILSSIGALKNPKESARITLLLLAQELQKQGHDIRIIAKGKGKEELEGIHLYRTSALKIPVLLRRLHREKKIDIVHCFSASPLFLLPHLGTWKVIHTLKSYSRTRLGRTGFGILRWAAAVTLPTKHFASQLPFIKKVWIIPSPINLRKFFPQNKESLKKKYGYEHKKIILYYGALWKNKGVEVLLRAVLQITEKNKNIKLLILPRYPQIQPQQQLVQKLGIQQQVDFITDSVAIEDYVNLADVVVLPYLNLLGTEGNPSCLLEAMACKTAVVTSDLPELREIAEGCVLFAEPGNAVDLAKKMMEAFHLPSSTLEKAYHLSQRFADMNVAVGFLNVYKKVLDRLKFKDS